MKSICLRKTCQLLAIVVLIIVSGNPILAQSFQRAFGTSLDNSFTKVIKDGSFYYVLGQNESVDGAPLTATVTRLDINGLHLWTLTSDVPSVFNDAVLLPGGDLLVVGWTLPFDPTNSSLIGRVTSSSGGYFTWLRRYNAPGREGLTRIVLNPMPEDSLFPYYTIGFQHQLGAGGTVDDVVLFTLDEMGAFGWKKVYPSIEDQEFFRDLEVYPNGDLLMAGNNASGIILKSDNAGIITNGVLDLFTVSDVEISNSGDIYATSNAPLEYPRIIKLDQDLLFNWEVEVSQLTSLTQIWEGASGELYVTGRGIFGGTDRAVIIKIDAIALNVLWTKYLNSGSMFTGGSSWLLPGGSMAFTDSRIVNNSFGQTDAFISISDLELLTCHVSETVVDLDEVNPILSSPEPPVAVFQDPQGFLEITNIQALNWQQLEVCNTVPCTAGFTFEVNCGVVTFAGESNGTNPTWEWTFSGGNPTSSTDQNPVVTFPPCETYEVCLTVTEVNQLDTCIITTCHDVMVLDTTPPVAMCAGIGVQLDANCEAVITPQMIDGGTTDDCMIQSMSVSPNVLTGCGLFPVTLTVTDWCGNTSTCIALIQASEDVSPIIGCPANITINAPSQAPCSVIVSNIQPTNVLDNCSTPSVSYIISGATTASGQNDASGTTFNQGVSLIIYTAEDECGNMGSCTFTVNVNCTVTTARIVVTKYNDLDCDGLRELNDIGLAGWQFKLVNNTSGVMYNGTTNVQGQFTFINLPLGTYTLTETQQPGWVPTNPVTGSRVITLSTSDVFVEFGNCDVCLPGSDPLICEEPVDVLFVLDNSGSISSSEFIAMRNMVNNAIVNIGSLYSDAKFGVVHYGGFCGRNLYMEHDFKIANAIFGQIHRRYNGTTDDLHVAIGTIIAALNHVPNSNLHPSPISFLNQRNGSNLFIIIFTDARSGVSGACTSSLLPYGNANLLKQSKNAKITVVQLEPGSTVNPIGAAIASPGGTYTGPVGVNGYDDPATTGISNPRQYLQWNFNPNFNTFLPHVNPCNITNENCCDSLNVASSLITTGGLCCAALDLENKVGFPVTKFEAEVISSPGWVFNVSSLAHASGFIWESPPTGQKVGLNHSSGKIPLGTSQQALSYCLASTSSTPSATQTIVFRWYAVLPGDSIRRVICTDTLLTDCFPTTGQSCVALVDSTILCNPENPYEYFFNFTVQNLSGSPMSQVVLQKLPPGFGFSVCNGSTALNSIGLPLIPSPLANGAVSSGLCVKIISPSPILSPQQICFRLGLSSDSLSCTSTDSVCVTIHPCCDPCDMVHATVEEINVNEECCYKMDLHRSCGYDLFTKVETEILTPGVIFGTHAFGGPDSASWFVFPGETSTSISFGSVNGAINQDLVDDIFKFCLDSVSSTTQIPQRIVVRWYTGTHSGDSVLCTDTLILNVPINCEKTCIDGSFSELVIRWNEGSQSQAISCSNAPITLSCPEAGKGFFLTGRLNHSGDPNENKKTKYNEKTNENSRSGSVISNPYFGINLLPTFFEESGLRTLTLTYETVEQTCTCTIQYNVDCTNLCPCTTQDITDFTARVERGFALLYPDNSCTACFSPLALNDCDSVEWHLNSTDEPPIGTSVGMESFCYDFPDAGSYNVIMNVSKKKSDGMQCDKQMRLQPVQPCQFWGECSDSVIDNPTFSEGAVVGELDAGGNSTGWKKMKPSPAKTEVDKRQGSFDGWTIDLSGNIETAGILTRFEPICLERTAGLITVRIAVSDVDRPCDKLVARIFRGDVFNINECPENDCYELVSLSLADLDTGWNELLIPYNLRNWDAVDACGGSQGVLVRPAIYVTNGLGNDQGGENTYSFAQLDNFCFGGNLVAVEEPVLKKEVTIFPNPTTGELTIAFNERGLKEKTIMIIDLYGRILFKDVVKSGVLAQSFSIGKLPPGVLIVKVVEDDEPALMEKIIKH